MRISAWPILLVLGFMTGEGVAEMVTSAEHIAVYREEGRFAGWPANHGIWSWGDEILVGFEIGYFRETRQGHAIDYERPAEHVLARSLDGGRTWALEKPPGLRAPAGSKVAGVPVEGGGRPAVRSTGNIPFDHPDFALTARMASHHTGPSRFYYSIDRGKSWEGPFLLPDFGTPGIAARTDYLIDGPDTATLFLTAAKSTNREGRVLCARTHDGGRTWNRLSFLGPEPEGDSYSIMPASVRLSEVEILTAVRQREWIEAYRSMDNGHHWTYEGKIATEMGGNPPDLLQLSDGRLLLVYGYREAPYGIRARFSGDQGVTWSPEWILRRDGGNWDLGYPRTVQRSDGKLVTLYYFNLDPDEERFITATIWAPPSSTLEN